MKHSHDVLRMFTSKVPHAYGSHMFSFFSSNGSRGIVLPFLKGLVDALWMLEQACTGVAEEFIGRLAPIKGNGESQFEALMQICAEIYVAAGAVAVADKENGQTLFNHEPRATKGGKNPEFEFRYKGTWIAVEVKTPKMLEFERQRSKNDWQLPARSEMVNAIKGEKTLPRDNPVKDFLASAEAKFSEYKLHRPDAWRLLAIVWTDHVQEPVSSLLSPHSGLLTANSFLKDENGNAVLFPNVDGVILYRQLHILRLSAAKELAPLTPFVYARKAFPPKVIIANPHGRPIDDAVHEALDLTPIEDVSMWAEYIPSELILWINTTQKTASAENGKVEARAANPRKDGIGRARETSDRRLSKIGRNELCPCGSGKKFKKCCWLLIK